MNKTTVLETLKKIIQPYIQDEIAFQNFSEATQFVDDLKINSAHLVDIILDVEDEFDIEFEDDEFEDFLSAKQAVGIILEKINA